VSELEPTEVESRRAARDRALELLYEAEVKGLPVEDVVAALPVAPADMAIELVAGVEANRDRIDAILRERVAPKWTLARLAALDRAVLRLATYELLDRHDRSQAVVINEAVVLARRYGTDQSPRFVNGVLSAIAGVTRGGAAAPAEWDQAAADLAKDDAVADEVEDVEVHEVAPEDVPDEARPVVVTSSGRRRPERPAAAEPATADIAHPRASGPPSDVSVPDVALRPADALVIDLDGVIRHWHPDAVSRIEDGLGLPAGTVGAEAFAPVRLEAAMRGELAFDDWCAAIGEAVAAEHPVAAEAVAKGFAATSWDIDGEVLRLVDAVRVEAPVALMSNASTRLVDDLRSSGIADRFDAVVGSAAIGAIKPEPAAYLAAARHIGTPPERCLFVDDRPGNVIGAREAGMQGHLFTGAADLEAVLQATGLLPRDDDIDDTGLDDTDELDDS